MYINIFTTLNKKKALSPLITVILLIIVSLVFTTLIMSWTKETTHRKLSDAGHDMPVASDLECSKNNIFVESCSIDYITKDVNLVISNPSNLDFSNLVLSLQGETLDGNSMKLVGSFISTINKGETVYLSTSNESDFNYTKEDYNHILFNPWDINNFLLTTTTCPNNFIDLKGCDIVDGKYGLVGYWSLAEDDASGTIIYDLSDYDNNGTSYSTPVFTINYNVDENEAMYFNDIVDFIYVSGDEIQPSSNMSLSCWFKSDVTTSVAGHNVFLRFYNNSDNRFYFSYPGHGYSVINGSSHNLYDFGDIGTTWHHFAVTMNGTTYKYYIDGVLTHTDNSALDLGNFVGTATFYIGGIGNNNYRFQGSMSDVRVYNRTLNESEVKSLYLAYIH